MNKIVTLLAVLLLGGGAAVAQHDFTLYNMPFVPQVTYTNPATMPNAKVNVGLPIVSSVYGSLGNSGFRWGDLVEVRSDDSLTLNIDNALSKLKPQNYLLQHAQVDLFSVGFRLKEKSYVSFNVTEKSQILWTYPEDLMRLLWEGNGKSLLGQRANMDGLAVDATHWREYSLGYMHKFGEKLTIGGKAKYLYGMENIWTKTSKFGLTTDEITYELSLDGELELYTSGINKYTTADGNIAVADFVGGLQNRGFGLDLGAHYELNDKIDLSASVVDFGFINWKEDLRHYRKDAAQTFAFDGVDAGLIVNVSDTSAEAALQTMADSLEKFFDLEEFSENYRTSLTTRFMLGGAYNINENHTVGGLFHGMFLRGSFRPALTVSYNLRVKKFLSASVSWSAYNRSVNNLGIGLSVNLGPVQIYGITDNVIALPAPHAVKMAHTRIGMNLTFGRKEKEPKEPEMAILRLVNPANANTTMQTSVRNDAGQYVFDNLSFADSLYFTYEGKKKAPKNVSVVSSGDTAVATASKRKNIDFEYLPPVVTRLLLVDSTGNILQVATVDAYGTFTFQNLPADQMHLFRLEGEDVTADSLRIKFLNDGQETIVVASKNDLEGFNYQYLPASMETTLAVDDVEDVVLAPVIELVFLDSAGNTILVTTPDDKGRFVFENLPPDQNFLFELRGDENFLDTAIPVWLKAADGSMTKITATKNEQPGFFFEYLQPGAANLTPEPVVDVEPEPQPEPEPEPEPAPEPEHTLYFSVQIGLYSQEVPISTFKGLQPIDIDHLPGGQVRYRIGAYTDTTEAEAMRQKVIALGITDAWVCGMLDGERVTMKAAKAALAKYGNGILRKED